MRWDHLAKYVRQDKEVWNKLIINTSKTQYGSKNCQTEKEQLEKQEDHKENSIPEANEEEFQDG